jgi:hypothetical protein
MTDEDWEHEAALMSHVYSNSTLNISATAATNGSEGLFPDPYRYRSPFAKVSVKGKPQWLINQHFWYDNITLAPLNQRAWVCQERLLSPKNLHFAMEGLFWECNEKSWSDKFALELPPLFANLVTTARKRIDPAKNGALLREHEHLKPDSNLHVYDTWGSIVSMYSRSLLTKPTDKLVAISGLALKIFRLYLGDLYLAGLLE